MTPTETAALRLVGAVDALLGAASPLLGSELVRERAALHDRARECEDVIRAQMEDCDGPPPFTPPPLPAGPWWRTIPGRRSRDG